MWGCVSNVFEFRLCRKGGVLKENWQLGRWLARTRRPRFPSPPPSLYVEVGEFERTVCCCFACKSSGLCFRLRRYLFGAGVPKGGRFCVELVLVESDWREQLSGMRSLLSLPFDCNHL